MTSRPHLRCAIYTRKSSEEGLGQEFNSLDAQREACAAYVASQKHEGWKLAPERYDDGGLSGGTLERPALQRLLSDIDAGRVRMVVVYKIDRLTRSLADFAKLVERLEKAGCSFVSVTQAFNTSSSMGRLTLNVLLSFAQFEREVTAERIRDKIAASKRKGMWMGGTVPLGYDRHPDPMRRELVVNEGEAEQVRTLFRLYDELGCLRKLEQAAAERGYRSKRQVFANGRMRGGGALSRGQLHYLLTNTTYRGLVRHKAEVHPGLHPAIIDEALWAKVQARLQEGTARPRGRRGRLAVEATGQTVDTGHASSLSSTSGRRSSRLDPAFPALLTGRLRDETGDRLTPTHTTKAGRQHRYYVSHRLLAGGAPDRISWRLPAAALEQIVARVVADHLKSAAQSHSLLLQPEAATAGAVATAAEALAKEVTSPGHECLRQLVASGHLKVGGLTLTLNAGILAAALAVPAAALHPSLLSIAAPLHLRRRGVEAKLIAGQPAAAPDPTLTRMLARAHRWATELRQGKSLATLAQRDGCSESYLRTRAQLAFLSPKIQTAILEGIQPPDLSLERLVRTGIPLDWTEQEQRFGFGS